MDEVDWRLLHVVEANENRAMVRAVLKKLEPKEVWDCMCVIKPLRVILVKHVPDKVILRENEIFNERDMNTVVKLLASKKVEVEIYRRDDSNFQDDIIGINSIRLVAVVAEVVVTELGSEKPWKMA